MRCCPYCDRPYAGEATAAEWNGLLIDREQMVIIWLGEKKKRPTPQIMFFLYSLVEAAGDLVRTGTLHLLLGDDAGVKQVKVIMAGARKFLRVNNIPFRIPVTYRFGYRLEFVPPEQRL